MTSPPLPDPIDSPRLVLPVITAAEAHAMLSGQRDPGWHPDYPRPDDLDAVSMLSAGEGGWGPRRVVRRVGELTCGSIGFFGPPSPAEDGTPEVEVGYGLVAEARGRGVASEALGALLAETDRLGVRVRASVDPENAASLRVLAGRGFTRLRGTTEDGELVMVRPLPKGAASTGAEGTAPAGVEGGDGR